MKGKILEAAEKIFSEKGYHDTKVYQIAEAAGVSVGTIYRFYNSKEELYAGVIKIKLKELEKEVDKAIRNKNPREALEAYISTVIDFFENEKAFFELFMREVGSLVIPNEERLNLSEWYNRYVNKLSAIIKEGIEREEFRELDPKAVILSISGALKNILYASVKGFINLNSEDIKKTLITMVEEGILKD